MSNLSNLNGRVLEYLITEAIAKSSSSVKLTTRANEFQRRDVAKLKEVDPRLITKLNSAVQTLQRCWIEPRFVVSKQKTVAVDRLPDQNKNDVTDIRLTSEEWTISLSMKHNHSALKHQRPRTTPIHCGFTKGDSQLEAIS